MKYQVAIIGGGPAGYTAAEAAGKAGLSVVLFEKQSLGGVCRSHFGIRHGTDTFIDTAGR
jgi:pyruvate/2-oxoglutarate dehydrogenase complex dihydrolipoamide dehydrogenase (E3) component